MHSASSSVEDSTDNCSRQAVLLGLEGRCSGPITHLCSIVSGVSSLPEVPFNHVSALYYLVLLRRVGLCSLLHVSQDLLSPFSCHPFTALHRAGHSSSSRDTSAVRMLRRCSDQIVLTLVGKAGFHLIIAQTSGHKKRRRTVSTPQGSRT